MSEHAIRLTLSTILTALTLLGGVVGVAYGMYNGLDKRVTVLEINDDERIELREELKTTRNELKQVRERLRDNEETQRGLWRDVRTLLDEQRRNNP